MTCDGSGFLDQPRRLIWSFAKNDWIMDFTCSGCPNCKPKCPDCGFDLSFFGGDEPPISHGFGEGWDGFGRYWTHAEYPEEGSIKCECKP